MKRLIPILAAMLVLMGATTKESLTHWAFQPVKRPPLPVATANPIDAFVLARLEKEKIAPSPEADRITLLRRVSLDLTGLPPTSEEAAEYLRDKAPDAYGRLVGRLLASPHFGEKWARHWLDQARYADSDGYEKDWVRPYAWRYRQWVIDAINRDMPFDRFSIEQLAGDLLPDATTEQRVATGFHRMTLTNREGGVDNTQFRFENTVDRAATTASVWLGITAGCAQCHDHKYDPISQKNFYQLYAFFDHVEEVDIDAPMPGEMGPFLDKNAEYRAKREALLKEYNVPALQAEWEKKMLWTSANLGKETNWDLAWDCLLKLTEFGDGEKIVRIPPEKRTTHERDVLADHFIRNYHFGVGPKIYKEVKFAELDGKLRALYESYPQLSQAMTLAESGAAAPTHIRVRGDYKALGIEVAPGVPEAFPPLPVGSKGTRLDLARWLFRENNPLTARVAVNRMWQELFGQGIVKTSEDLGVKGSAPSHPELLDRLASEFRESGWSRKQMLRLIVTSATYKQSSNARPELQTKDPTNVLLARQARLRLPGELIRDSALSVSGLLLPDVGGKSVRPPQPAGVTDLGYGKVVWNESQGQQRYRRGLYIHFQRMTPYPMLMNFDGPKANVAACRRERSNTPLQALNLLNDPAFMEAAQALASQLPDGGFEARLQFAFERALLRKPLQREVDSFKKYFLRQRAILQEEPPAAEGLDAAAWTGVASVLLNLDEFVTRE